MAPIQSHRAHEYESQEAPPREKLWGWNTRERSNQLLVTQTLVFSCCCLVRHFLIPELSYCEAPSLSPPPLRNASLLVLTSFFLFYPIFFFFFFFFFFHFWCCYHFIHGRKYVYVYSFSTDSLQTLFPFSVIFHLSSPLLFVSSDNPIRTRVTSCSSVGTCRLEGYITLLSASLFSNEARRMRRSTKRVSRTSRGKSRDFVRENFANLWFVSWSNESPAASAASVASSCRPRRDETIFHLSSRRPTFTLTS